MEGKEEGWEKEKVQKRTVGERKEEKEDGWERGRVEMNKGGKEDGLEKERGGKRRC